jgi:catechol 2,3-dioxygenase-like lactoylglutathione lyase family enzyme
VLLVEDVRKAIDYYRDAPVDQGYGQREFRVRDPDGYILAFGQSLET